MTLPQRPVLIGISISILIVVVILGFFGADIQSALNRNKVQQELVERSGIYNRNTPRLLNEQVKFERTSVDDNSLRFHYTLLQPKRRQSDLIELSEDLQQQMLKNLCNSPDMVFFRQQDVEIQYDFRDTNNERLSYIKALPSRDCR
ncbi:hypothetical protein SAMN06297229_1134 [Pseudidiomarina planktonica]|uniref:Uncharacterized protein n=1 Tax=Pseudidiomarina planktonica TaxID=1323738 RepID=A0A1Y6EVD6_9GAMM|nr:hypothetical protein [Pseudidiomarina planktonica]RUO65457.1 hypothetical protein CWI77_03095 [Pseudidiomarina planktonica]SMQ64910.1 hypothetical protein SAMN06297229_1134 [Pseudidiomarina planktonica]